MARNRRGGRGGRRRRAKPERTREIDLERYRPLMPEWSRFVEAANRPEPTVVRARVGRIDVESLEQRLAAQGFRTRRLPGLPTFMQVEEGPYPASMTREHWLGLFYVQQASTGVAAPALDVAPDDRVLDLCAAPGGKTTHIAELMSDRGCLVASEINESRIRGLLGNVYRLGHPNVLVVSGDGREFPEGALFDRVLVDAPCSGEGTLRRRAGRPPDQSASFLGYVTAAQRALLAKAVRLTRPGGMILYVTCTFSPEENEAVVSEALERLPVELEPLALPVPHAPGVDRFDGRRFDARVEGAARIYPHHFDSGGLFLAKLRRLEGDVGADAWGPVPYAFPDDEPGTSTADDGAHEASSQLLAGIAEVWERYGVERDPGGLGWTMRGGRAWMHTVGEWPLVGWSASSSRVVSVGLRAIEFDTKGRPRPTNDFLRWADATSAMVELSEARLREVLGGGAVPVDVERRGPIALGFRGDVLGRGAVTESGLKSEVPKARAHDLLRILDRAEQRSTVPGAGTIGDPEEAELP